MDRRKSSKLLEIKNREEVIDYFYNCMLTYIVDQWEDNSQVGNEYMPTCSKIFIIPNKSYVQVCDDNELINDEMPKSDTDNTFFTKSSTRLKGKLKRSKKARSRKFSSITKKSEEFEEFPEPDMEDNVIINFKNGNIYKGPCYKKKFHGSGKFRWSDGSTYVGDFKNGKMTGKGKFYFNDQSFYEGDVYQGYPHGYGKKYAPESPSAYCGEWRIGKKHGNGWVIYSEDNWYEGDWCTDKMHGNGIRCYSNGSKYQGDFHKGRRQGNGCAILWNNDFYVGEWVNGKRTGHGQYIWNAFFNQSFSIPVQNKYIGNWAKDRMHGKGELHFGSKNGARYIGEFYKNYKHGGGLVVCDNGDIIQCDPIFANDKPVHLQGKGIVDRSLHRDETCIDHCQREYEKIEHKASPNEPIQIQADKKCSEMNKTVFMLPSATFGKMESDNVNLCQLKFAKKGPVKYCLRLPINSSGESINLDPHIRKLCSMIDYYEPELSSSSDSFSVEPNSWEEVGVPGSGRQPINYNYQEIYNIEEKALRRAININLRRLREIYKQYSLIGCLKNMPFETIMNRLFLWQMYRDCKISEKGVSLTCIDLLLAEDSISFSESIHDPFENIYFWQFLTSLVKTSWEIYGSKTIRYVFEGRSILEEIFTKFLNDDIFPNVGHHLGTALFDYKDIIPIKSAYNWYKSIGEPMTIKTFVLNIFTLNKKEIHTFESPPKDFYIKTGKNISIGNNVIFLEEEEPKYCIGPKKEKVAPLKKKCLKKKLYFLHDLPMKLIYKKIRSVVPGIFINKECFNHEYNLCFLEFYEIVLICTQHILRKKELKFKKKNTKISENETVYLKTITAKKSKQYRKSASHHSIAKRPTS